MGNITRARPTQGQFVVRRLGLAVINLLTKFEISSLSLPRDILGGLQINLVQDSRMVSNSRIRRRRCSIEW